MMQLSAHFSLEEFLVSQTAARMGRAVEPTESDVRNLTRLCVTVLEPLRIDLRRPIHISSGLRPVWLNQLVGGSTTSAHTDGRAADIEVPGMSPLEVCQRVVALQLPVDQAIHEFPPNGWAHLGIARDGEAPRNMLLTARVLSGRTVYERGLNA
jgi:zinc D-Ala-D-Ala carboxypeptidase